MNELFFVNFLLHCPNYFHAFLLKIINLDDIKGKKVKLNINRSDNVPVGENRVYLCLVRHYKNI